MSSASGARHRTGPRRRCTAWSYAQSYASLLAKSETLSGHLGGHFIVSIVDLFTSADVERRRPSSATLRSLPLRRLSGLGAPASAVWRRSCPLRTLLIRFYTAKPSFEGATKLPTVFMRLVVIIGYCTQSEQF